MRRGLGRMKVIGSKARSCADSPRLRPLTLIPKASTVALTRRPRSLLVHWPHRQGCQTRKVFTREVPEAGHSIHALFAENANRWRPRVPKIDAADLLRPHLAPGERLEWSEVGARIAPGGVERMFGFVFAGSLAFIVTVLAGVEELLPGLALPALFIAVFILSLLVSKAVAGRAGSRLRVYGITDRRVLVLADGALQVPAPGELATLQADRQPDGSVDLFWGWKEPHNLDRRNRAPDDGSRMKFHVRRRTERIGFIGLASEEPARTLIRDFVQRHYDAAVPAAPAASMPPSASRSPAAPTTPAAPMASAASTTPDADWHTVREPASGLAIDLPSAWQSRVGLLKRTRVLGVLIESPETKWFDSPGPGWNRLEVNPGVDRAILQVDLDPPSPPADLAAVANDRLSKVANVKLLDTHPDLRIGSLAGFGVTQGLKGAGIGVGSLRVGESIKADLVQTQMWLRGADHSVHVIFVAPSEATALREAMQKVVGTLRLE
jgi:hypothetical protein